MSQININVTPEFEKNLKAYMKKKGIRQKSEAIRSAVSEAAEKIQEQKSEPYDFSKLLGIGLKAPLNPNPRFKNDDDLWVKDSERK